MSIAVVIPAYNSMKYFRETLESVLGQTLPPDEVIVIDDGSTDGTPAFAESYGSPVRVLHRKRQRQAANRNLGVLEATSEWVAFLDHDDIWAPNKLELQMAELNRTHADLCYSARLTFFQDGDSINRGAVIPVPPASEIRRALYINTTFMPGSVLIRRSTYLTAGGFDHSFKYVEDWDFWLRLLHSGVVFADCQEPLLRVRLHASNLSNHAKPALLETKEIWRRHVLPRLPRSSHWIARQRSQSGQEAAAAYVMREANQPGYLSTMLRSIARYPFNEPHRYKSLLYTLYIRLRKFSAK